MTQAIPASGEKTVLAERRDSVLLLTLNRPGRLNAWNDPLEEDYFSLLDEAEADPGVRAVVLTGAGRAFCAGADLGDLEQLDDSVFAAAAHARPRPRHRPYELRKPLIAAINGAAVGLGLVEALYCDVRFCTPRAKLGTAFTQRGLIAEYGVSWLLPRLVGAGSAADLLLSSRTIDGTEAYRIGLVEHLVEPEDLLDAALAYATDLTVTCSPTSMAVVKEQLRADLERAFEPAFADADRRLRVSLGREDVREGVRSYIDKRAPEFAPL